LESNWRYTPFDIGWGGVLSGSPLGRVWMPLAAELITPFVSPAGLIKWVVELFNGSVRNYGYGVAHPLFPDQCGQVLTPIGPAPFPCGRLVHPD